MSAASLDVRGIEVSSQELHDRKLLAGLPIDLPMAARVICTWEGDFLCRIAGTARSALRIFAASRPRRVTAGPGSNSRWCRG